MYRSSKCKCVVTVQMTLGAKNQFVIMENRNSRKFSLQGIPLSLKSYIVFKICLLQKWLAHLKPFKEKYLFWKNKYTVVGLQIGNLSITNVDS